MSWSYDAKTKLAGGEAEAPLRRVHVEEAINRLSSIGISPHQAIGIVTALSGLSKKEVAFNVELVVGKEAL